MRGEPGHAASYDEAPSEAGTTRSHFRRRRRWLLVPLLVVVLVGACAAWQWEFLFLRFGCVEEGVLYRSAALEEGQLERIVSRHGIRTIVNLRREHEPASVAVAKRLGLQYVWLPTWQTPGKDVVDAFLALMDDPTNHPVLLHCRHGVGRTGVLVAIYRLEYQGRSFDEVIEEARRYALWGSFWDDEEKQRYLAAYVPRREREDR